MRRLLCKRQVLLNLITAGLLAAGIVSLRPQPAAAHARVEVGPYVVIVGWLEEPVIVGERNAIFIEVTENETPVVGLEASLDVSVLYGGRTFIGNLSPAGTPGVYTAEIFPTVRGQYTVHLTGAIGDEPVDEQVDPEEVLSPGVLQFPEVQPELKDLQDTVQNLEGRLQTAYILAIAGAVLGLIGIATGVLALVRRPGRKNS